MRSAAVIYNGLRRYVVYSIFWICLWSVWVYLFKINVLYMSFGVLQGGH